MTKSSVFTGIFWASIQRFGTMIISFISNMILARLLTPDDFGVIGMLLFFVTISSTLVDSGFGAALIQKAKSNETDNSTVFYTNLILSVILYAILFFLAPYVALFYGVEELSILLRIEGLVLIINAFSLIQTILLRKELSFKVLSKCNLIGNITGAIVGILVAYLGGGVWSLVIRLLLTSLLTTILLWINNNWYPKKTFSWYSLRELFAFGGFMLLSSLFFTITNNLQTLLIGKFFKTSFLGNYTQANTLKSYMSESLSSVIGQVIYPDFANHQSNNTMMVNKLLLGVDILSYVTNIIMVLLIIIADPLIYLLYGNQWEMAIPFFRILCVGGVALSLQDINYHIIAAKGKSKPLFYLNFFKVIIYIALLFFSSIYFDIYGVLWAIVTYNYIAFFAFAILSSYYIQCNVFFQFRIILRNVIITILPGVVLIIIKYYFDIENSIKTMFIDIIVYIVSIFLLSQLLKLTPFEYLINNITRVLKKNG